MTDILVREGEVEFAKPIARSVLRDSRLSFGARGLFCFLWDMPLGWRPIIGHLVKMAPEGRDAVRARLGELQKVGAMRIEPIRKCDGKVAGKRWVLIAADRWAVAYPLSVSNSEATESRVSPQSVEPMIGDPGTKVHPVEGSPKEEAAGRGRPDGRQPAAESRRKRRRKRPSGIVTWDAEDEVEAHRLESLHSSSVITAAVDAAMASDKQPVPGVVEMFVETLGKAQRGFLEGLRLREEVEARVASTLASGDVAIEAGRQILDEIRKHRKGRSHGC